MHLLRSSGLSKGMEKPNLLRRMWEGRMSEEEKTAALVGGLKVFDLMILNREAR